MISVLIPVYNYPVKELVHTIHQQLETLFERFEIICFDDASSEYVNENSKCANLKNVRYELLNVNIGRSSIRNKLLQEASFDWLLFLDADVLPNSIEFIEKYSDVIESEPLKVFSGGLVYQSNRPAKQNLLRWVYGTKREEIATEVRISRPYDFVLGANFLIHKSIFEVCTFDERIKSYGIEDTLFVEKLKENRIGIGHISNAVIHLGLESSIAYLNKSKLALINLKKLMDQRILKGENLKIIQAYSYIEKFRIGWFFNFIYHIFNGVLRWNLKSSFPLIFLFDLYKLLYYCHISTSKST